MLSQSGFFWNCCCQYCHPKNTDKLPHMPPFNKLTLTWNDCDLESHRTLSACQKQWMRMTILAWTCWVNRLTGHTVVWHPDITPRASRSRRASAESQHHFSPIVTISKPPQLTAVGFHQHRQPFAVSQFIWPLARLSGLNGFVGKHVGTASGILPGTQRYTHAVGTL